jgi:hypothetical protein
MSHDRFHIILHGKRIDRVFENSVLRRMFIPKREEETGEGRKLRNEELHNCSHPEILGRSSQGE